MSFEKPLCPIWCPKEQFAIKEISSSFFFHRFYAFDLCANPTRAVVQRNLNGEPILNSKGKIKRGKRIPLVQKDELMSWIERKARMGGFRIVDSASLEIGPLVESFFSKKGNKAYHGTVQFRGILEVIDRDVFQKHIILALVEQKVLDMAFCCWLL